jgi:hypothetical protein
MSPNCRKIVLRLRPASAATRSAVTSISGFWSAAKTASRILSRLRWERRRLPSDSSMASIGGSSNPAPRFVTTIPVPEYETSGRRR